jgi:glycosyltransferase involved in cell wall biosynthesis
VRLAWFSPWPPQKSGVGGRSIDATRALAGRGAAIDVFVDQRRVPGAPQLPDHAPRPGEVRVQPAHDFVWRQHHAQYDLAIYQVGNSTDHAFVWPYLLRYPGLAMLHDARLHHARGKALIRPASAAPYRRAFACDHPDVAPEVAELAVAGFDGVYYALWPMVRSVILASRAVGVHTRGGASDLQAQWPDRLIDYVALGEGRDAPLAEPERHAVRQQLGIRPGVLLFGVSGGLTPDKRVPQILEAFARLSRRHPDAHLLLAGAPAPHLDVTAAIARHDLASRVTLAPDLDDEMFDRAIAAVDVSLHLRWPTARETSGPWLQALAAARPTVIIDLAQHAHVPVLDPRTWQPPLGGAAEEAVAVGIDIVDEEHSLALALARLAQDAPLRARLGAAGRRYWEREHSVARMADDYERLIARTLSQPQEPTRLPPGMLPDPCQPTRDLLTPFGKLSCALF